MSAKAWHIRCQQRALCCCSWQALQVQQQKAGAGRSLPLSVLRCYACEDACCWGDGLWPVYITTSGKCHWPAVFLL
jgi:hypothetical protein